MHTFLCSSSFVALILVYLPLENCYNPLLISLPSWFTKCHPQKAVTYFNFHLQYSCPSPPHICLGTCNVTALSTHNPDNNQILSDNWNDCHCTSTTYRKSIASHVLNLFDRCCLKNDVLNHIFLQSHASLKMARNSLYWCHSLHIIHIIDLKFWYFWITDVDNFTPFYLGPMQDLLCGGTVVHVVLVGDVGGNLQHL